MLSEIRKFSHGGKNVVIIVPKLYQPTSRHIRHRFKGKKNVLPPTTKIKPQNFDFFAEL